MASTLKATSQGQAKPFHHPILLDGCSPPMFPSLKNLILHHQANLASTLKATSQGQVNPFYHPILLDGCPPLPFHPLRRVPSLNHLHKILLKRSLGVTLDSVSIAKLVL
ncbi:hypothetical protein V6N13_072543 [Hibiscus sabdariffa]|uniref:Uncharacterized protein n=1 Tax=Hibiscus sabdariffa TaxID=183260 RepID=A0ABR2R7B1_9ROSI